MLRAVLCELCVEQVSASLFEYTAGFLWGGYAEPLSKMSALYQLIIGFFMLIVVSSYTANLAAAITTSQVPFQIVNSVYDAL